MGLDFVLFDAPLDVVDDKFSLVVHCGDIANAHGRSFECAALNAELFLPLREQF